MYNRYIPQSDGTYRRNRIQDTAKPPERPLPASPPPPAPVREPEKPCSNCIHNSPQKRPQQQRPREQAGISGFLKQLLPKEFEIEDLMVVLLLLLMAGDCQENQNTALLTLVLYLFL